jgi:hypothetical protein
MSNDWIPIKDAKMDYAKQYEVTYHDGSVRVRNPAGICFETAIAVREYNPTPYVAPVPIDPGDGWRLLGPKEAIMKGDCFLDRQYGTWHPTTVTNGGVVPTECEVYRRRIEPTYRPFANAAEYVPHRERWLIERSSGDTFVNWYYSETTDWKNLFERYIFEDTRTPFGVEVVK